MKYKTFTPFLIGWIAIESIAIWADHLFSNVLRPAISFKNGFNDEIIGMYVWMFIPAVAVILVAESKMAALTLESMKKRFKSSLLIGGSLFLAWHAGFIYFFEYKYPYSPNETGGARFIDGMYFIPGLILTTVLMVKAFTKAERAGAPANQSSQPAPPR